MTLQERRQYIINRLALHKARAYDLKLQLEAEENTIIALSGAMETIADLEKQAKAEAEHAEESA